MDDRIANADVKEIFATGSGSMGMDGGSLTRDFVVEGDMAFADAALKATEHPDIPHIGHLVTANGFGYYLESYDFERGEDTTEAVWITCNYRSSGNKPSTFPQWNESVHGEAERQRRERTVFCPFNERLEFKGEDKEVLVGEDADGNTKVLPEKTRIMDSKTIWKFDVNTVPDRSYWSQIGNINSVDYPPTATVNDQVRTYNFDKKNLMYLGASGQPIDDPYMDDPDGNTYSGSYLYKFTFSFAFRYQDWDWEKYFLTKQNVTFDFEAGQPLWYYHPDTGFTKLDDSATSVPAQAEMPLLTKDADGNFQPSWSAYIPDREPVDFTSLFNFYWGELGD